MIDFLINNKSLGADPNDLVLFGGHSAGARGAMVHLDKVAERLKEQKGLTVLGILDSPLYLDLDPLFP